MPSRLGSEQLRDEITAVLELVKNAYDADATSVTVELREHEGAQSLKIQDDGSGMTLDDLHAKWAWLATENKVREERSPIFRRRRLGQKGVGRFATEKLGRQLLLRTRTEGEDRVFQISFDWSALSGDRELSEYEYPVKRRKPESFEPPHGTCLEIRGLRMRWRREHLEKLRDQLARLIDPESAATDFKILLITPWQDLNGPLHNPLPGSETHRVDFELSADGQEITEIVSPEKKERQRTRQEPAVFGPLRGKLRYFGRGLRPTDQGRGGDPKSDWNVGVRLFRDGFRVRPYGEPGPEGDWLQIYRTRYLRGSRFRLKPHYLEGSIHISNDYNPGLRDTTSREGLEANDHFEALVKYIQEKVLVLSELIREDELREERSRIQQRYQRALDPLSAGLNQVRSEEYRRAVEDSDRQVRKGLHLPVGPSVIRNAHWECLDCTDAWKAPRDLTPTQCREFSVGRDGRPTRKPGCGSSNIRRKENVPREEPSTPRETPSLEDVMAGAPAYVSGIQLRPLIDWEMGENDEEAEVRSDRRELAINGRHQAFRAADLLDGKETVEGTELEELRAVAALTIHIINAASEAWGRWHYTQSGEKFDAYLSAAATLKAACLSKIAGAALESEP